MKRWLWLILVLASTVWVSIACAATYNPVSPSNDLKFPKSFVQYWRGVDGLYYDTGATTTGSEVVQQDTGINDAGGSITTDMADVTLSDTIIDLALTDTATVYHVVLPAKTVAYEFQARGTGVVDYSMTDSTVAVSYWTVKSGYPYNTFGLGSEKLYTGTIYFKCPLTAAEVMEIRIWTKP